MSTLAFTIIQTDLTWEDPSANLAMLEKKINDIPGKAEIVLLPEMFSTGFSMEPRRLAETMDGPSVQWMKRVSAERKIILAGSLIIAVGDKYYNRLIWMLPNGQMGHYDKAHRFALAGEDQEYTAGTQRFIASVKGWKINLMICYDLRFPVWARQQMKGSEPEYDVLVYLANWPDKRSHAWRTLLQARAIENQCYVIGVNRVGDDGNGAHYSGDSMVVDPLGEVLYQQRDTEDVRTVVLEKSALSEVRERLPFWNDADTFAIFTNEDKRD